MEYTDKEICKSYMQNPCAEQVEILSELNCCELYEILNVLSAYGIKVDKNKITKEQPKEKTVIVWKTKSNPDMKDYIHRRRAKLEFMSLCFPERQKEWISEMLELMEVLNKGEIA